LNTAFAHASRELICNIFTTQTGRLPVSRHRQPPLIILFLGRRRGDEAQIFGVLRASQSLLTSAPTITAVSGCRVRAPGLQAVWLEIGIFVKANAGGYGSLFRLNGVQNQNSKRSPRSVFMRILCVFVAIDLREFCKSVRASSRRLLQLQRSRDAG
jgi:hypothetical protein